MDVIQLASEFIKGVRYKAPEPLVDAAVMVIVLFSRKAGKPEWVVRHCYLYVSV